MGFLSFSPSFGIQTTMLLCCNRISLKAWYRTKDNFWKAKISLAAGRTCLTEIQAWLYNEELKTIVPPSIMIQL